MLWLCLIAAGVPQQDQSSLALPVEYVAKRQSSHNPDVKTNDDSWHIPGGKTVTLMEDDGPGMITHIWTTIADNEYAWPRLLRLRVYYEGAAKPSVDVPLGDFFACGHGIERDVNSLMVRCTSQGRAKNCYWQMPYLKHIKITLTNEGVRKSGLTYFQIDYRRYARLPANIEYFHASYRQESPATMGKNYPILDTTGRGKFVGVVLSVIPNQDAWFGEGNDYFYVDGEKQPSLAGTGTEDFLSDGWGLHEGTGPYYGTTIPGGSGTGDRLSAYRWFVNEPVPFKKSLHLEIEHSGWTNKPDGTAKSSFEQRDDDFSSVAFWYQSPFRTDFPELPTGSARLPYGNATVIPADGQIASLVAKDGKAEIQKDLFWFQSIVFFGGTGVDSELTVPFQVADDGKYEVMPTLVSSYDYGIYTISLDGGPPSGAINLYAKDVTMPAGYPLRRAQLKKGAHSLTFRCTGKAADSGGHFLGVDQIVLSRVR